MISIRDSQPGSGKKGSDNNKKRDCKPAGTLWLGTVSPRTVPRCPPRRRRADATLHRA